jgi:hypothetical protein
MYSILPSVTGAFVRIKYDILLTLSSRIFATKKITINILILQTNYFHTNALIDFIRTKQVDW